MNTINIEENNNTIIYTLRGPLNSTLKSKLKNKTSKILNNSNIPRILSTLHVTDYNSEETIDIINKVKKIKPDLLLPAVQLAYISNRFSTNILTNSKEGTFIKMKNKSKHFKNIGSVTRNRGYFLRKGAGTILMNRIIKDMKNKGIKTILVHPSNKDLEKYYSIFGFIIIPKVFRNYNTKQYYENNNEGHMMYLEL